MPATRELNANIQGEEPRSTCGRRWRWLERATSVLLCAMLFTSGFLTVGTPAYAQDKGTKPPAGDKPADKPGDKPADKPLEDRQKWPADKKADEAIKHAKLQKEKAEKILKDDCPKNKADWEKWSKETLEVAACLIAMREIKRPLRKTGPAGDKLKEFDKTLGDDDAQKKMNTDLFEKAKKCAEAAGVEVDGPGIYKKILKRAEEAKAEKMGFFGLGPPVVEDCCPQDKPKDDASKFEESRPEEEMEEMEREMGH